jgi:hypothetical protein
MSSTAKVSRRAGHLTPDDLGCLGRVDGHAAALEAEGPRLPGAVLPGLGPVAPGGGDPAHGVPRRLVRHRARDPGQGHVGVIGQAQRSLTGSTGIRGEDCSTRSIRSSRSRGSRIARSRSRAISPSASIASARRKPGRTVRNSIRPFTITTWLSRGRCPSGSAGHSHSYPGPGRRRSLVIITQVRQPGQDNGVARRELNERSMPPIPRVIQNVGKTSGMPSLMPCAPHRRDDRVASGPVCGRTGSPCGFRNDGVELRDLSCVNRKLIIRMARCLTRLRAERRTLEPS